MSRWKRRLADRMERLLGIHLFRQSSAGSWPEAEFERKLFEHLRPDCVFDVGANVGQYAGRLRSVVGYRGPILSFEPNPDAFVALQRRSSRDPDWHCWPYGLGSSSGDSSLNVTSSSVFASLKTPLERSQDFFPDENVVERKVTVHLETVDSIFDGLRQTHGFQRPFLKLDTQGYDLEVIAGGMGSIGSFVGILSEVSVTALYEETPRIGDSLEKFEAIGFIPVDMFNVHPQRRFTRLLECNCYCVRKDLVVSL